MLHRRGTAVYLISGGFRSIIEPVAKEVDIPSKNIFANRLSFYFNGKITPTSLVLMRKLCNNLVLSTCGDPESFVRGGLTLMFFLV